MSTPPSVTPIVAGVVAGVVVALVLASVASLAVYLIRRRRRRAGGRLRDSSVEGSVKDDFSPVDKPISSNPFMTDAEARTRGVDLSRQSTRRMEARFTVADPTRTDSLSRSGSASSRKMLLSRSPTTSSRVQVVRDVSANDVPIPAPAQLSRSGTDAKATPQGSPFSGGDVSSRLEPQMEDLIVQLGLHAAQRPVTPSKIIPERTL